jgi:hypothetical protein
VCVYFMLRVCEEERGGISPGNKQKERTKRSVVPKQQAHSTEHRQTDTNTHITNIYFFVSFCSHLSRWVEFCLTIFNTFLWLSAQHIYTHIHTHTRTYMELHQQVCSDITCFTRLMHIIHYYIHTHTHINKQTFHLFNACVSSYKLYTGF